MSTTNSSRIQFTADLFKKIVTGKSKENVIFSPASIHTCVILAYFGADGETAEEMRKALNLGNDDDLVDLAKDIYEFIANSFKSSKDENNVQLCMANRIYVNQEIAIKPVFNEMAEQYFQSKAEKLDFNDAANAAKTINTWVEEQTNAKVKNVLSADSVASNTSAILVNAIYFKGKWAIPFDLESTNKAEFAANGKDNVLVDMMYMHESVRYADFGDFDAKILELPYKNSNLSMWFLLPNKKDGLKNLEKNLAGKDFNELSSKLSVHKVKVNIPRFCIEFGVNLKRPLEELGMKTMFKDNADFTLLFESPNKISEVQHKAYIDVNEGGSEAAAATIVKYHPVSREADQKDFRADHPFVFFLRSSETIYFAGHVTKF